MRCQTLEDGLGQGGQDRVIIIIIIIIIITIIIIIIIIIILAIMKARLRCQTKEAGLSQRQGVQDIIITFSWLCCVL